MGFGMNKIPGNKRRKNLSKKSIRRYSKNPCNCFYCTNDWFNGLGLIDILKEIYKNNKFHKKLIKQYGEDEGNKRYMGYIFAKPIIKKLDYVGMCSKFITVKELPEGKPIIFDKK